MNFSFYQQKGKKPKVDGPGNGGQFYRLLSREQQPDSPHFDTVTIYYTDQQMEYLVREGASLLGFKITEEGT